MSNTLHSYRRPAFTLLSFILFICTFTASAQSERVRIKLKADMDERPDEKMIIHSMIRADDGALVAMKIPANNGAWGGVPQGKNPWSLATYARKDMHPIKTSDHMMVYGIGPVAVETIVRFNKKMWLIGTKDQKDKGSVAVLFQEMDPRSLTAKKGANLLGELPYNTFLKGPEWFATNEALGLEAELSTDSSMLVLRLDPANTIKGAAPHLAAVFNKDRSLKWVKGLQTDGNAKEIELLSGFCDETGAMWYLMKNITDPDPTDPAKVGYDLVVYRLDSAEQKSVVLDLPSDDIARHARMVLRSDGKLVIAGIYAEKEMKRDRSAGIFHTTLDRTSLEWGPVKKHEYTPNIEKEKPVPQRDMQVEGLLLRSDGGVIVVTDERDLRTHMSNNFVNQKVMRSNYITKDLHIMELKKDGTQKWYTIIDRNLFLDEPNRAEPIALMHRDVFFILMNDDEKNEALRKDKLEVPQLERGGEAMLLEFQPDGSYRSKVALSDRFGQGFVLPQHRWATSPNEVCILGAYKLEADHSFPVAIQYETDAAR